VKSSEGEIEVQDVFLDKLVLERERESEFTESKLEIPLSRWILRGLYACFILIILVFFGKTFHVQVFSGAELKAQAEQNAIRSFPLGSERGVVYDSSMKQLVFNRPSFDFVCDKRDLPEGRETKERILRESADILDIEFAELKTKFSQDTNAQFLVGENLSHEQLIVFEAKGKDFEGCEIQKNTIREYEKTETLSHILGYTAKVSWEELENLSDYFVTDQIGKTGVERSYEAELRGNPGKVLVEKDALGNIVNEKGVVPSEPGDNLVLWLDLELVIINNVSVDLRSKNGFTLAF